MKMMKTVRFILPLLVTTFGFAAGASAQIYYPWCANYADGGFSTHEQCMATISGTGGLCDPNPFYTPPSQKRSRHQYKQHN
jgi:hypothetical protein